jgi:hypothetical protein
MPTATASAIAAMDSRDDAENARREKIVITPTSFESTNSG